MMIFNVGSCDVQDPRRKHVAAVSLARDPGPKDEGHSASD